MKKITLCTIMALVACSLIALSQQNGLLQTLLPLNAPELQVVEAKLPVAVTREAATTQTGDFSVIVFSGPNSNDKQNAARYLAQKVNGVVYKVSLSRIISQNLEETKNYFDKI